jgi:hypothetical protein
MERDLPSIKSPRSSLSQRGVREDFIRAASVLGALLLAAGCATIRVDDCARFEQERKDTNYATRYERSESESSEASKHYKPLPKGALAVVRLYRVRMNSAQTPPCRHVNIEKELYLQRAPGNGFVLEEVREILANNGTLIAAKTETLSSQLAATGYYTATVPFPIPDKTPAGKYRLSSRLVLRAKGGEPVMLARSTTQFTVQPAKAPARR